ncbi:MAG: proline racemase family protein [Akkermansiaceae bacterium]
MDSSDSKCLKIIDSHTAGEPTRVVVSGGPVVPEIGAAAASEYLRDHADWMRRCLIDEPRGFEAVVGAFLCEPLDTDCIVGVVFFNNAGYLHSCIHGMIGVMQTLRHLGRIEAGVHKVETPIGTLRVKMDDQEKVTVENVPSYRLAERISVEAEGFGKITGDVAWGGNWFFLISEQGPAVKKAGIEELIRFTKAVRRGLLAEKVVGDDGHPVDHVEVFAKAEEGVCADSQNFVLCPGGAYDRSACGTGTSAKVACLAADGALAEGEIYRQAGILGEVFEAQYRAMGEKVVPSISGRAWITAESRVVIHSDDPFRYGAGTELSL